MGNLDEWGHKLGAKLEAMIRMCFQNIRGINMTNDKGPFKLQALKQFVHTHQIEVLTFAKHNTSWDITQPNLQLPMFTKGWWEHLQWTISYNQNQMNPKSHQPGGMGILTLNVLSHCALRPGEDPLHLGRLCWTRFQGRHGQHIRVVSLYRPCFFSGPLLTYQQQIRHLAN